MIQEKVRCTECHWKGLIDKIDMVKDPKSDMVWQVCPNCRIPENLITVCDEKGCWDGITCGTPTKDGYRSTCSKHQPNQIFRSK